MSNLTYSLLVGRALDAKPFPPHSRRPPHYHLLIGAGDGQYDVAVNIASEDPTAADKRVLYAVRDGITPPNVTRLSALGESIQDLPPGDPLGLDYIADNLVSRDEMSDLPLYNPGDASSMDNAISQLVQRAVGNAQATVYAYGHRYEQSDKPDPAWGFRPDDGLHNIHMNQGNPPGKFGSENGRHEDGTLLIHFTDTDTWSAVYVAFQTQSWDNDAGGYPIG